MIVSSPPEETSISKKIKSHGYWRIVIRPTEFESQRVSNIADLAKIIAKASVSFRGWDFPHIDNKTPTPQGDWIRDEIDWSGLIESWVFFQSGQFLYSGAIRDDWWAESFHSETWKDKDPGKFIEIYEIIFKLTEIYEFAARLATAVPGNDSFFVSIQLVGLKNRNIYMAPNSSRFFRWEGRISESAEFHWAEEIERTNLLAQTREHAAKVAAEIFKRFKWDAPEQAVREIQQELKTR